MIRLDTDEMREAQRSAVLSAELLRRSGEPAKAGRLESLAQILARRIEAAAHEDAARAAAFRRGAEKSPGPERPQR